MARIDAVGLILEISSVVQSNSDNFSVSRRRSMDVSAAIKGRSSVRSYLGYPATDAVARSRKSPDEITCFEVYR